MLRPLLLASNPSHFQTCSVAESSVVCANLCGHTSWLLPGKFMRLGFPAFRVLLQKVPPSPQPRPLLTRIDVPATRTSRKNIDCPFPTKSFPLKLCSPNKCIPTLPAAKSLFCRGFRFPCSQILPSLSIYIPGNRVGLTAGHTIAGLFLRWLSVGVGSSPSNSFIN